MLKLNHILQSLHYHLKIDPILTISKSNINNNLFLMLFIH